MAAAPSSAAAPTKAKHGLLPPRPPSSSHTLEVTIVGVRRLALGDDWPAFVTLTLKHPSIPEEDSRFHAVAPGQEHMEIFTLSGNGSSRGRAGRAAAGATRRGSEHETRAAGAAREEARTNLLGTTGHRPLTARRNRPRPTSPGGGAITGGGTLRVEVTQEDHAAGGGIDPLREVDAAEISLAQIESYQQDTGVFSEWITLNMMPTAGGGLDNLDAPGGGLDNVPAANLYQPVGRDNIDAGGCQIMLRLEMKRSAPFAVLSAEQKIIRKIKFVMTRMNADAITYVHKFYSEREPLPVRVLQEAVGEGSSEFVLPQVGGFCRSPTCGRTNSALPARGGRSSSLHRRWRRWKSSLRRRIVVPQSPDN